METPTQSLNRTQLVLVSAVIFFFWVAMYLFVPTLPVYVRTKTTDLALVGTVLAQYGLWQALTRLPVGIAADWIGWRKPFIIGGILLTGLGALVMGASESAYGVLVGRAVTGLAAASWVPLVVAFSSLFPPAEAVRATAIISLINNLSRMISTSFTGTLNEAGGYPLAFYAAAGVAGLALVAAFTFTEKRRPMTKPSIGGLGRLVLRRDVLLPALLNAVMQYATWASTFGFFPILAKEFGATDVTQSLMVTAAIGIGMLGNLTSAWLARRLGNKILVVAGFGITAVGLAFAWVGNSMPWVWAATLLVGYAQGIGYPVLMGMSIENVSEVERTTAMGLHQAVYATGMFAGPAFSGFLAKVWGLQPMFAFSAGFILVLGLVGAQLMVKAKK